MTDPAPRRRRRIAILSLAVVTTLGLIATACARPPAPSGWASARAIQVDSANLVLVARKGKLYALQAGTSATGATGTASATSSPAASGTSTASGTLTPTLTAAPTTTTATPIAAGTGVSANYAWQFPPADRSLYPLSEESQQAISTLIDGLSGISDADKSQLKTLLGRVRIGGPGAKAFKDAVSKSAAPSGDRSNVNKALDAAISFEKAALDKIQAFYGDIGLSSDGKTLFIGSFKGMVFALDASTGNARWVRDAGAGIVGGIAVDGDTIYFGTKGRRVYALVAATGVVKWQFSTDGEVWATPTVDNGRIYVTSLGGTVYALNTSGQRQWVFNGAGAGIASRAVVADGVVYAGAFDNKLYAINASDGSLLWTLTAGNWFWATPVVQDGVLYAASLDGKVYAVDARTGAARWPQPFDTGAPVRSSPVVVGGGLVVAARDGRVYKLDLTSGQATAGPVTVGANTTVLADLSTDGESTIYLVPTSAELFVLTDQLQAGSVPLP